MNKQAIIAAADLAIVGYDGQYPFAKTDDLVAFGPDTNSSDVREELVAALSKRPTGKYRLVSLVAPATPDYETPEEEQVFIDRLWEVKEQRSGGAWYTDYSENCDVPAVLFTDA